MLQEKKLSEYMVSDARHIHTQKPVTVEADASISSILEAGIAERHCNNVYVVDSKNKLLGIIKTKDLLKKLFPVISLTNGISGGVEEIPVFNATAAREIMTPALSVTDSVSLAKLVSVFLKENILELPVVDDNNIIIGHIDASEIIALSMR
jgi:CBS-domain-containing membrane protein